MRYELLLQGQPSESLSKQQAVNQAVAYLVSTGTCLPEVRVAVGNRWKQVAAASASEVAAPSSGAKQGMSGHWWFDSPYRDETGPGLWWVMVRVGGMETEQVLTRLAALAVNCLAWQRAVEG